MPPYASFVAPITPRGNRVMMVRNANTGEWMMPGGLVDPGETSHGAAARELREESGFRPRDMFHISRRPMRRGTVNLYATHLTPQDMQRRRNTFQSRGHRHETDDYGFVDLRRSRYRVEGYSGQPKATQSIRSGSVGQLNHMRRLHRGIR